MEIGKFEFGDSPDGVRLPQANRFYPKLNGKFPHQSAPVRHAFSGIKVGAERVYLPFFVSGSTPMTNQAAVRWFLNAIATLKFAQHQNGNDAPTAIPMARRSEAKTRRDSERSEKELKKRGVPIGK
jgi:hypothetical protein